MYEDIFTNFSEQLINSLQWPTELATRSLDAIYEAAQNTLSNFDTYLNQNSIADWADQLSAIYDSIPTSVEIPTIEFPSFSFESLNFLKDIDLQQDYIHLTEDDCDSINAILQPSDTSNDAPLKVSKGKMTVSDFIKNILLPIFGILLPLLLTIYFHKVDSIESQKRHIEELQLREKELQLQEKELHIMEQQLQNDIAQKELLEGILIEAQSFSEYFESLQEAPECPCTVLKLPFEDPEHFAETPYSPDGTQDNDLSNPDMSNSLETGIHTEQ